MSDTSDTNDSSRRPNILFLMPDQFRHDALSCAGHPAYRTPHIDRLAAEGVRFTCAYANAPLCMPARASVVSGLYPHNHHIWANAGELPANDETFAHLLQQVGYHTAYVGKSHFYQQGRGVDMVEREPYMRARGFEDVHETPGPHASTSTESRLSRYWRERGLLEVYREDYRRRAAAGGAIAVWPSPLPEEDFLGSYIGARALDWLRSHDGGSEGRAAGSAKPFFLWVGFGGPHEPWDAPRRYATMYDPQTIP